MYRLAQDARDAHPMRGSQIRRLTHVVSVVEYSLLTLVIVTMVSTGATLMGNKLNGVFLTVASAMDQSVKPQNVLAFGQTTNRKGAPIQREVSGKFSVLVASPLF